MKPLTRQFYARDTIEVARDLLGKLLVSKINKSVRSGIIVEAEAYGGLDDPASHAKYYYEFFPHWYFSSYRQTMAILPY